MTFEDWFIIAIAFLPIVVVITVVSLTGSAFAQRCVVEHKYERESIEWRMCVDRLQSGMAPEDIEREIRNYQNEMLS
jgi:hypothetical protein